MDFHNFTHSSEFDQEKVNKFLRLSMIPGFVLLRSEREYLEKYREVLRNENKGIKIVPEEEKKPEVLNLGEEAPKKTRKARKTEEPAEEPAEEVEE